jgi:hypothetical protein
MLLAFISEKIGKFKADKIYKARDGNRGTGEGNIITLPVGKTYSEHGWEDKMILICSETFS